MKRWTFLVLIMMVLWFGMVIWTFFWWSWKSKENRENIQNITSWLNITSWFINELAISWNLTDQLSVPQLNNKDKKVSEIKIMMPKYFYNSWWKKFAEDLYSWQKIYINFIFVDNLNRYRDTLSNESFSDAHLALVPYDRKDSIPTTKSFSFQKDIKTEYDNFLSNITSDSKITFLPFSIDPMIMYVLSWYSTQSNFPEILNFAYDRNNKPSKPMSFPIFFGITKEDYNKEWFIREYQDIMRYSFIHYFTTYRDKSSLKNWMETNALDKYNIIDLNKILNAITTPECEYFPSICLQLYKFVWIRFWFLSDNDIVSQYFKTKKDDFNQTKQQNLPFSQLETPVRIRGRIIPNSLQDANTTDSVYMFLSSFMNLHDKYELRNTTIPAFKNKNNEWYSIIKNPLIWIRWYILQTWWNYLKILRNTKAFRELLDYEITAWEYLNKT